MQGSRQGLLCHGRLHAHAPVTGQTKRCGVAQLDTLAAQGVGVNRLWWPGAEEVGMAGQTRPAQSFQGFPLTHTPAPQHSRDAASQRCTAGSVQACSMATAWAPSGQDGPRDSSWLASATALAGAIR